MRSRSIAILIDGGFFLKRLPKLVKPSRCGTPEQIVTCINIVCRNHVRYLTGDKATNWHQHVYRIFFYDADPYDGTAHHPLLNKPIEFAKSDVALQRAALFERLRRQRNVALRLGKVVRDSDWHITGSASRKIIATKKWIGSLALEGDGPLLLDEAQRKEASRLQALWAGVKTGDVQLGLRQKGVDMRIGVDIASITLKRQASTIVLIAGDSDFVPAAKLARREGVEFILDPMWQSVNDDLFEHIDGLHSGLPKPGKARAEDPGDGQSAGATNGGASE